MSWIAGSVKQPVTVTVGVLLVLVAGAIALDRLPIQLTPNVEDTIVAVTTRWEGASPQEIEQEVVDEQEDKLQGIANLRAMTSTSQQGQGRVRLEFNVGTSKEAALREVSDKLREVPSYPDNVDEPVIEATDPDTQDYIAWVLLETTDADLDVRTLQDFADDRIKPALERIPGMSEVNVLGGVEQEVQVRFDPLLLAQHGIEVAQLIDALRSTNRNVSAGAVAESKSDVRLRYVGQYERVDEVLETVIAQTTGGPIRVADVGGVVETFKEPRTFVRSRGKPVIALNFQKEVGANVMQVMKLLERGIERMNEPDGVLAAQARKLGLDGTLRLRKVYDQTIYIDDALSLVKDNIWLGGGIAIVVLLLFLRSIRSAGIITLAIPISVIGAIVFMVAAGRSINVISLAGLAFAIGMVVDNAIVVLENIFRHLEMGKAPHRAAVDGTKEVFGAVLASTLTTVVVFVPILLIQEEAGQLFRDIALAIVAAVTLSLVVSLTVIPAAAARLLKTVKSKPKPAYEAGSDRASFARHAWGVLSSPADAISRLVYALCGSVLARIAVVALLTIVSVIGTWFLLPPSDYLPQGNRNLVFGILVPPPGYSLEQQNQLALRIEDEVRPYFEAGALEPGSAAYEEAKAALPAVATFDYRLGKPGDPVVPPPIENYFLVSFDGIMFHGGISAEPSRVVDMMPLFAHATRADIAPGVLAFAFQVPLFQLGGRTGSAVKVNFTGDDLDQVSSSALAVMLDLMGSIGPGNVQPDPGNFNIPGPELRVIPDLHRLAEIGLRPSELASAVQALGDGVIVGDYRVGGQTIDLKVLADRAEGEHVLESLGQEPLAAGDGQVVPLAALAKLVRVNAPPQINREGRQRAVTLQVTAPAGMPLETVIEKIEQSLAGARASGAIPADVETSFTGSASKLAAVRAAMLGDGTLAGTLSSSLLLALLVTYLLMCVLFQSFMRPLIILFSVPLATFGGFAALYLVFKWSESDRYLPVQNLDVLTMLGFVILIGVVVNNAILIVHQSLNFMRGEGEPGEVVQKLAPREAIAEAVRTRVRPIFMSTLTSVGGMAPLVLMPGSGSELYRGLGSVVVGGLLVSTIFTLLLVPLLLSLASDLQLKLGLLPEAKAPEDRRERVGAPTPSPVAGVVLLSIVAAGALGGCSSPSARAEDTTKTPPQVQARRESLVGAASDQRGEPLGARSGSDTERFLAALGGERALELERGSGPDAVWGGPGDPGASLAGTAPLRIGLARDRALIAAATNNLDLRLAQLGPDLAQEGEIVADAAFDFVLFADGTFERVDEPSRVPVINSIPLGVGQNTNERGALSAGARKPLRTGGSLEFTTFLQRFENKTPGIDFAPDPAWSTGVAGTWRQPLLRGAGRDVGELALDLAQLETGRADARRREELLVVLAATDEAYWDLGEAWARLRVAENLLQRGLAVEQVLSARRQFDAEPAQVSDALATVERRRVELVRARRVVRAASDRLKSLMLDPELSVADEGLLEPLDRPDPQGPGSGGRGPSLREALELSFSTRPELARARLDVESALRIEQAAEDGLQPTLDLTLSVAASGLDDQAGDSVTSVLEDDFLGVLGSLRLELPAGNRAARAEVRRARIQAVQTRLAAERALETAALDVKDRLLDLDTALELVERTRRLRLAAAENLRALEVEKSERTSMTPEFLALEFQRQEGLAAAQADEAGALAEVERARARLERALGRGPGGRDVRIDSSGASAGVAR